MPWEHCGNSVFDDQSCPSCGLTKAQWTVQIDNTRVLQLSRKVKKGEGDLLKVRLYQGQKVYSQGEPYRITFPNGSEVAGTTDRYGYAKHPQPAGGGAAQIVFPARQPAEVEGGEAAPEGGTRVRLSGEGVHKVVLVARRLPLRLRYETAHPDDVVPVKERHVALERPSAKDAGFGRYRTDAAGYLHEVREGEPTEATLARVLQAADASGTLRLVVSRRAVDDEATQDADRVEEVTLEEAGEDAERHYLAWVRRPPRLVLPIEFGRPGRGTAQERTRRFSNSYRFRVQVDGEEVPCGANVTEEGRLEVVFRIERGRHTVQVSSFAAQGDGRELVYFARTVRVR